MGHTLKCYGHLKILTIANSFIQEAFGTWTTEEKKIQKTFCSWHGELCNKRNSSNILPNVAICKKECIFFYERQKV